MDKEYISIKDANGNIVSVDTEELREAYFKEFANGGKILGMGLQEICGLLKLYQSLCWAMPVAVESIDHLITKYTGEQNERETDSR